MRRLAVFVVSVALTCLFLPAGIASAVDDLFKTGSSTTLVGNNNITVTNNFKYVNYVKGDTLNVTLTYAGDCGVSFVSLGSRVPKPFTPSGVTGVVNNVNGTTPGVVTFDVTFNTLKKAGKSKEFGVAHIDLNLAVDDDCFDLDPTEDVPLKVGVQVSASPASHP